MLPYPPTSCHILDGFMYLTTMVATVGSGPGGAGSGAGFAASDNQKRFKTTDTEALKRQSRYCRMSAKIE